MHRYVRELQKALSARACPETAAPMAAYMRDKFPFLGIKAPLRRDLLKAFLAERGLPDPGDIDAVIRELWQLPEREYAYCAMDVLLKMKRHWNPGHAGLLEQLITEKSWWDTVDLLASHVVGGLFKKHPPLRDRTVRKWRTSKNVWLRRTAILFQLRYKTDTDEALLFSLIEENLDDDEFFIRKAIGWALREYSKTAPQKVKAFVKRTPLSPLSEREALKWLARQGR